MHPAPVSASVVNRQGFTYANVATALGTFPTKLVDGISPSPAGMAQPLLMGVSEPTLWPIDKSEP